MHWDPSAEQLRGTADVGCVNCLGTCRRDLVAPMRILSSPCLEVENLRGSTFDLLKSFSAEPEPPKNRPQEAQSRCRGQLAVEAVRRARFWTESPSHQTKHAPN